MKSKYPVIEKLEQAVIVSSQASDNEPLNKPEHLCALALSGLNGGARGLRLEGAENIKYIRKQTDVPIIGLIKSEKVEDKDRLSSVYITASFAEAKAVSDAGADIIAIDATPRKRPDGLTLIELIERIHKELNKPVWADVSTLQEGLAAAEAGADVVSTTLYGYTEETKRKSDEPPDFELLGELCKKLSQPVVLEGRVWYPHELSRGFELGAYAVVVGSAITRPQLITRRFVKAVPERAR
ncbi:MAG: N-acetylmannosamine-6-phosphate 2-epimerase [Candidatus Obscuribacterales bacterium]|nr:N-acetylmannosamine-6-phosphate 2-epimerase [Candidatus Obscuribacterales bacterium]